MYMCVYAYVYVYVCMYVYVEKVASPFCVTSFFASENSWFSRAIGLCLRMMGSFRVT